MLTGFPCKIPFHVNLSIASVFMQSDLALPLDRLAQSKDPRQHSGSSAFVWVIEKSLLAKMQAVSSTALNHSQYNHSSISLPSFNRWTVSKPLYLSGQSSGSYSQQGVQHVLLVRGSWCRARAAPVDTVIQDAAAAASSPAAAEVVEKSGGGILAPLTDSLEALLKVLQDGLITLHVPYSYGFSIILLTLIVKAATYPLTKQQIESSLAVQTLKPRVDLIKARYGDDKDKISKETNLLYEQAGVNPLAGCLPTLATIPIFIGLFSSLTNAANEGLFDTQGFFWIPSLAGPTSMAARQAGLGTSWLFPFVDGAPPIGWEDATAYLVLPVALVLTQYLSTALTMPPIDESDPSANTTKALNAFLPLMIGWFSLNVPSGLVLYYMSNTVLTLAISIYLKKLGGAQVNVKDLGPVTKPGSGRRTGPTAMNVVRWESQVAAEIAAAKAAELAALSADEDEQESMASAAAAAAQVQQTEQQDALPVGGKWLVKRKKLELMLRA